MRLRRVNQMKGHITTVYTEFKWKSDQLKLSFGTNDMITDSTVTPLWRLVRECRHVQVRIIAKSWKQSPVGSFIERLQQTLELLIVTFSLWVDKRADVTTTRLSISGERRI